MSRLPSLFVAHGAPMLVDDEQWMGELAAWGRSLARPKSILIVSAHWQERPFTVGATQTVPLTYDFYGFPPRYYALTYPAPGAPELAARVRALVGATQPVADDPQRGLDHGAFVPLLGMFPQHDVPVLQVSLPSEDPSQLLALGRTLAPLRDEGVLVIGSGFLTHNLRAFKRHGPPERWAVDFDAWVKDVLERRDLDALVDYRRRAPGVAEALPTHEHFLPLFVTLGAAADEKISFPIDGFWLGSFSRRSVQLG